MRYRGAGLFCTGDREGAAGHGAVCLVFPIEGFQFCWSPLVGDLHVWSVEHDYLSLSPDAFVSKLSAADYRDRDLRAAVASRCEVMVACERYHAVVAEDDEERALLADLALIPGQENR